MRLLKRMTLIFGLAAAAVGANAQVLERYSFQLGTTNAVNQSPGGELRFTDRFFGNGTAQSRIILLEESSSSMVMNRPMMLSLQVRRVVKEGEIVLALLVSRVEIRGYDSSGQLIWLRDMAGFRIGDSSSGRWHERVGGLPTGLAQITVTFYGNYA
jgi:hypothetical protein